MGRSTVGHVEEETAAEVVNVSQRRVPGVNLGLLVLRVPRGLLGNKVIEASKDTRGRKETMAMVVSWVLKEVWE